MDDTKRPIGRPEEYDPKYCQQIIEHMSKGYSKEASAALMGFSKMSIYRWAKKHKDFSDAIKKGETLSQLHWENQGNAGMWAGKDFQPSVWIFNMRNRFGWSDNPVPEQEDEDEYPEVV